MVKNGDRVKVHYTGTLNDGSVFDSSEGREPLEFTLGEGSMIPGFEKAVNGMNVGETRKVTIPADEAYGQRRDEMTMKVSREQLPPDMSPSVGDKLQMTNSRRQTIPVTVTEVSDSSITIDANHELAGKDLTFEIRLVSTNTK